MKLTIKAGVGTTRKPASRVISVRVDESEYNICSKLATEEQRTLSLIGSILLQKGLAESKGETPPTRKGVAMSKVLGMNCPYFGKRAQVQTSKEQSRTMRDVYFQCTNLLCGHTWVAALEAMRTISPPSPVYRHPDVHLPLADRAELERVHDQVQFDITGQRTIFDAPASNLIQERE